LAETFATKEGEVSRKKAPEAAMRPVVPEILSAWMRAMRQNQRIILRDVCIPSAWDFRREPIQVAAPA
jgi:hypothetical protein